ncbi:MAG: hypothetical protein JOY80_12640 [Candidatus Dormibacteraeota bacterium]|nr:hypothetical protein [Candidatus Dormibacteraeota bacterium]
MTMSANLRGHRLASAALLVLGGAAVSAAVWTGGNHSWAIGSSVVYLVLAVGVYAWAGRTGDIAAILRAGGDERQRSIDRDGLVVAAVAMTMVAVVGAIIQLGRTGNPGVYGLFCVVEGAAFVSAVTVLHRRR